MFTSTATFGFSVDLYLILYLSIFSVQTSETLMMSMKPDEGRGRCPYDPYQRNTAIIVGQCGHDVTTNVHSIAVGGPAIISRESVPSLTT